MKDKLRSLFFAIFIIIIALINILSPEKVFSSKENRYLKEFPSINKEDIFSGKFGSEFEEYSTDQFILRDKWISLKTRTDLALLKKDNGRVYFGKDKYLFEIDNKVDKDQFDKNIQSINLFLEKTDKNVSISGLFIPSKSESLKDKLPNYAPTIDEKALTQKLQSSLGDRINVMSPLNVFNERQDEYLYYKTDHHWTSKGAYYAYKFFMENRNKTFLNENNFKVETVSNNFLGTTYRKANYYSGVPDDIEIYLPKEKIEYRVLINEKEKSEGLYDSSYLDKTDKYSYFLSGNNAITEINTNLKNNKSILVIKDSFANSFIPFLVNHYENITVIDLRYFNSSTSKYIEEKEVNEVLFLFNIKKFANEKSFIKLNR